MVVRIGRIAENVSRVPDADAGRCLLVVLNGIEVRFLMALVQWCSCFLFSGD